MKSWQRLAAESVVVGLAVAVVCAAIDDIVASHRVGQDRPLQPGPPAEPAPVALRLADQVEVCSPILTEDARVRAFGWCDRLGGFTSSGWAYVECWTEERYAHEEGHLLFRLEADGGR